MSETGRLPLGVRRIDPDEAFRLAILVLLLFTIMVALLPMEDIVRVCKCERLKLF